MVVIGLLSYSVFSASQTSDNWGRNTECFKWGGNIDCLTADLTAVEDAVSAYLKLSQWGSLSWRFLISF